VGRTAGPSLHAKARPRPGTTRPGVGWGTPCHRPRLSGSATTCFQAENASHLVQSSNLPQVTPSEHDRKEGVTTCLRCSLKRLQIQNSCGLEQFGLLARRPEEDARLAHARSAPSFASVLAWGAPPPRAGPGRLQPRRAVVCGGRTRSRQRCGTRYRGRMGTRSFGPVCSATITLLDPRLLSHGAGVLRLLRAVGESGATTSGIQVPTTTA
jgi:hypothetical protein